MSFTGITSTAYSGSDSPTITDNSTATQADVCISSIAPGEMLTVEFTALYTAPGGTPPLEVCNQGTVIYLDPDDNTSPGTLNFLTDDPDDATSTTDPTCTPLCAVITADAGTDQTICPGTSATFSATGSTNYLWSTGDTDASITVTPTANTTYAVTVSDINGCSDTDDVMVSLHPAAVADAGADQAVCPGGSATLTASGGTSYAWDTGDTDASITVTPTATTTYVVTVTDANTCTATDDVQVTVHPAAVADAGADQAVCPGGSATLTASGGTSYAWDTGDTDASITVTPTATTTYVVTVTDATHAPRPMMSK